MKRMQWIVIGVVLGTLLAPALRAQSPEDSMALAHASWKIRPQKEPGLICRTLSIDLFGSPQQLFCLEIDTSLYHLRIVQDKRRRTPGAQGRRRGAAAAINGGFFVTKTCRAIANDFLKIEGEVQPFAGGWGRAGIGIDSTGQIVFVQLPADFQHDTLWHRRYRDVLTAGPLLLLDHRVIPDNNPARHPRSMIGQKDDGTLMLVVVDGRRRKAAGVSLNELACIARALGLRSALNLDGGGSSALWIKGQGNVNRPSDRIWFVRFPRDVANSLLVIPR